MRRRPARHPGRGDGCHTTAAGRHPRPPASTDCLSPRGRTKSRQPHGVLRTGPTNLPTNFALYPHDGGRPSRSRRTAGGTQVSDARGADRGLGRRPRCALGAWRVVAGRILARACCPCALAMQAKRGAAPAVRFQPAVRFAPAARRLASAPAAPAAPAVPPCSRADCLRRRTPTARSPAARCSPSTPWPPRSRRTTARGGATASRPRSQRPHRASQGSASQTPAASRSARTRGTRGTPRACLRPTAASSRPPKCSRRLGTLPRSRSSRRRRPPCEAARRCALRLPRGVARGTLHPCPARGLAQSMHPV